jgi:DNA-binding response OmpR family regulator/class 3 adenylate cyclase/predicted ATPase/ABC-type transport system involved in cytochrome c biogenesis ATPase subunit
MKMRVLVAVEEFALRAKLAAVIQASGYVAALANVDQRELRDTRNLVAAIVAPTSFDGSGLALARELCADGCRVIVITDPGQAFHMASHILPDAHAFLTQPLDEKRLVSLLAQITAGQSSKEIAPPSVLRFEGRSLDLGGHAFFDESGREVPLTRAEFELLALFARFSGRVLSRDQLRNGISGRDLEPYDRSVDMLVARLRRKIEPDAKSPRFILTTPGVGYKFAPRVQQADLVTPPQIEAQMKEASNAPRPAERRQLSILACQIRGLAAISARLDPEDEGELMSSIHRAGADIAARYHGVVARILGDSLLIYFGYAEAQEHDAEHAVRTGLELIDAIGNLDLPSTLHPHIGIATDLMMVGASPGPPNEFAATGQALNLALRLQSAAPPDSVLVTSRTRELVGDFFNYQEMDPLVLADDLAPVKVWCVTGESTNAGRFEALRRTGMLELVGRRQEMELLRRCWSICQAGAGQVVVVTGEPGIGKSRLIAEFEEERNVELYNSLKYFGSPHQTDASLYAVIGELQRAAGFKRADIASERLAKLTALLEGASHSASEGVTLIADLLSLPIEDRHAVQQLTPQQRKEKTLAALLARIENLAARQPMLVLVEDAHWLDPTSVEFLSLLVELIPKLPVMVLITARPEFAPPWPVYAHVTCVTLARLSRVDAGLLVERVVGGKPLPKEVMSQILSQTDGVPLFIEELTKTLLESGILCEGPNKYEMIGPYPSQAIPKTLHGSLLARLDRLGSAKEIAQIGAVIGREFSHELLCAVCSSSESQLKGALQELISSELVFRRGTPPNAVYSFKHALVQDAAYSTLLREPRRALHARIAQALEKQFAEIAETRPELLARHCTEAGLIEKAAGLWGKAGLQSLTRSALMEATAQLNRALTQITALPSTATLRHQQIMFQVALANALMHTKGYASSDTKASFGQARLYIERAVALGEPPEDPLLLFAVIYGFWVGNYVAFNGNALRDLAAQFLVLAEKQRATVPLMIGHRLMGTSLMCTGDIAESRVHYDRAIALYKPTEHRPLATRFGQDIGVVVLSYRSWSLWLLGYPEAALADADHALKDAREIGQAATLMYALAHATRTYAWTGKYASANTLVEEVVALADEKSASAWKAFGMMHQGSLLALTGQISNAAEIMNSGIGAWRSTGSTLWLPCYLSNLARAYAKLDRFDDAWRCIGEAMSAVDVTKARWCEAEVHRTAGDVALISPEPDAAKAETCFARALTAACEQQAKSWELRAAISMARLWRDQNKLPQARDLLASVYGWFTEGFDTIDLKEAKALLDALPS